MFAIFLIGLHACGKTSLGYSLSMAHNKEFVCTDTIIEQRFDMRISDLGKKFSLELYREKERELMQELCEDEAIYDAIVDVGADIPLSPRFRDWMQNLGNVIYLKASPETIYEHLTKIKYVEGAGLSSVVDINKIREAYYTHHKFYEMCATNIIDIDGQGKEEVFIKTNSIYTSLVREEIHIEFGIREVGEEL